MQNVFKNDFWGTPMNKEQSHKSYRPLTVLTFRLNYLVHELEPLGYHLVNIILHAGVTIMYHRLCSSLLSQASAAVAATSPSPSSCTTSRPATTMWWRW